MTNSEQPPPKSDGVPEAPGEPAPGRSSRTQIVFALVTALAFAAALPALWNRLGEVTEFMGETPQVQSAAAFELELCTIDPEEIVTGGAGRDDIPALTNPQFTSPDRVSQLHGNDRVAGVVIDGQPRAYPLRILELHEVVNDSIGPVSFAVTYCPLCDSVAVFDRRTDNGGDLEFGVSGLLYKSNLLMYDRGTDSLWSQIGAVGVSGTHGDRSLRTMPVEVTSWADWSARHPETQVLSFSTGFDFGYQYSPYRRYFLTGELMFDVQPASDHLPEMAGLLGVWTGDAARAYPIAEFARAGEDVTVTDEFAGVTLTIHYSAAANSIRLESPSTSLEQMYAFWFAWYALHPHTEVFEMQSRPPVNTDG